MVHAEIAAPHSPAAVVKPAYPVRMNETSALFRSTTGGSALNGRLGQRAFAAEAGGRRGLAGQAADEIHEQLRQFLVVDRVVHRQRRQAGLRIRRVVAPPGQHRVDRQVHRARSAGMPRASRAAISRQVESRGFARSGRRCR